MRTSLFLFLIAFIIRLAVILWWRFDGLYGQDAYAYFNQATAITENLLQGKPPPTDFFWPNGYPLLIAFFMVFFGQTAWTGQLVALLCGAALAPLAYLLSRDLWGTTADHRSPIAKPPYRSADEKINPLAHRTGLFAGLIIAVGGQPILSSIVIMADMPALFWATLATWLVVQAVNLKQESKRAGEQENTPQVSPTQSMFHVSRFTLYFFAAGATLALAIISRWLYMLVIPALGAYTLFTLYQNYRRANFTLRLSASPKASFGLTLFNSLKIPWGSLLLAILGGVIILTPQLWLSLNKPEGLAHSWLLGWSPANFFQREFENIDGHFVYPLPNAIFYAQPAGHPAYIFPLLGLAALWGTWRLWQRRQWRPLILLLGWAIPVYLFLAGIPYQNFRFGLTLYLPLVILTGFGWSDLWNVTDNKNPRNTESAEKIQRYTENSLNENDARTRRILSSLRLTNHRLFIYGAIALSLAGMLAWAYPMLDSFLTVQNQSKRIAHEVEQALPPEATLITFGLTLTVQHYTQLHTLELFYLDEDSLKAVTESPGPLYLLLDVDSIESQWQEKIPQRNYQWLKKHTTLTQINTFPPYHLFKVTSST